MRLRLVSWNVHGCVGRNRRFEPLRTAEALAALEPDVALLQEVGDNQGAHPPVDQASTLARALGFSCALGITMPRDPFGYGNVTLSRLPLLDSETWDLSVWGREPRVCLRAVIGTDDLRLTTVNVHLGLGAGERRRQLRTLLSGALHGTVSDGPLVVGGDFNDFPPGPVSRTLGRVMDDLSALAAERRTWPSWRPLLRLDRVYARGLGVVGVRVDRSTRARAASDHLPIVVDIEVPRLQAPLGFEPP